MRRLRPVASYSEALDAFRAGRISACLDYLREIGDAPGGHLRARAWLRLGDRESLSRAVGELSLENFGQRYGPLYAERLTLRGAACGRRNAGEVDTAMLEAVAFSVTCGSPEHLADALYYRALHSFGVGEQELARDDCFEAIDVEYSVAARRDVGHPMSLATTRARALELAGLTYMADGKYGQALPYAIQAWEQAAAADDRYVEAFALTNVAVLSRDLAELVSRDFVIGLEAAAREFPWTPDLARKEFETFDALGIHAALLGDNVGAFRHFRRASAAAATGTDRTAASLQRAQLAYELDQQFIAREELDHATELATHCDWAAAAGDARLTLLVLAQTVAPIDPMRARAALSRYRAIRASSNVFASRHEVRVLALEHFVAGVVERHLGNDVAARSQLTAAYELWSQIGFQWRRGQTALELAEMSGADIYVAEARRIGMLRPGSWLARRASRLT